MENESSDTRGCIDANTVVAWFEGELAESNRREVHDHIDQCDDCRTLFVEMGRSFADAPERGPDEHHAPVTIGQRIGRYVVIEWLGGGGMGVVYGAYDPELQRPVALKVLRADAHGGDEKGAQQRLLREAQALARIAHPNVIAVFDAGTHDGQVFLAMEHLRGGTLAEWLQAEPRSWQAILARFLDAGRGLAAAHESGMVHRDFKPSNVLLGVDGRARVTDFGLAAPSDLPGDPDERSFVGTPMYMSPEQRARKKVDARSDQFSFCVAMHEALYGAVPGDASKDRLRLGVPARIRAALARGLSEAPSDRFQAMDALLSALARDRRAFWLRLAVGGAAVAGVALASIGYVRAESTPARFCGGAEEKLAGIWDAPRKEAVSSAFAKTHAVYAGDATREVVRSLDAYGARWTTMHTETCQATRVRGEQSEELMDLRMVCLSGQARELKALTELFLTADAKLVEKSVAAVYALPSVDACADVAALRSRVRPSADPAVRAKVDALHEEMIRARTLERAAQYAPALSVARPLLDPAKATADRRLLSDIKYVIARVQGRLGDLVAANVTLYEAVEDAEAAEDDVAKARALVQLTFNLGEKQAKYDEGARAGRLADAVLSRWPDEVELRAKLEDDLAFIDDGRGRYPEALVRGERAIALREKAFGPESFPVGMSFNNTSKHVYLLGDFEKALTYQKHAEVITERALGPHHPEVALCLRNMALSEFDLRRWDDAIRDVTRALVIWREAFGDEHRDLLGGEGVLAMILAEHGQPADGLPHAERALALAEKLLPADHPDKVNALDTIGKIYLSLGRAPEAIAAHSRAEAICKRLGDPPNETAETLHDLGADYLHEGQAAKAIALFERALQLREKLDSDKSELAETRMLLARALKKNGGDGERAITLAEQARDGFATQPHYEAEREAAEKWLTATRQAPPRR